MKSSKFRSTAVTAVSAFVLAATFTACGQEKPAKADAKQAAKPAAQAAAAAKAAPKTLEEVFVFLPDPVATIGKKKITKKEFLDQLGKVPVEYIAQLTPDMLKANAKQMVASLVDSEILLALAEKSGIKPSKELVIAEFDKKLKEMPKEQLDMVKKQLELQGKKLDDIKAEIVKDPNAVKFYAINKWVESNIKNKAVVSDADIQKYYNENQAQFKTPETITASHILISTMPAQDKPAVTDPVALAAKDKEAKAKAEKILADLKKGADFGAIAEKESGCPSGKQSKGKLPPFTKGQMVPEFEKAAFALQPGQLSGVVKTPFGYHIIKLESKNPAKVMPLDTVKAAIRSNLQSKAIEKQLTDTLTKEKKSMDVKILDFK